MSVGHARHSHHVLKTPTVVDGQSRTLSLTDLLLPHPSCWHLPLYLSYTFYSCCASTGTITLCFSLLCEPDPPVFSLHISVEQRLLGLEAAGQRHEDGVDILTLPGVLGRRFKQQHVVGIRKLQRRIGGNLRKSLVFGGKPGCKIQLLSIVTEARVNPTCIWSTRSHLFPTRTRGTDADTRWPLHS